MHVIVQEGPLSRLLHPGQGEQRGKQALLALLGAAVRLDFCQPRLRGATQIVEHVTWDREKCRIAIINVLFIIVRPFQIESQPQWAYDSLSHFIQYIYIFT